MSKEEMKFDALATLIANNHEESKTRMKDLYAFVDYRFTGIEEHNKKQNGSIAHAIERIAPDIGAFEYNPQSESNPARPFINNDKVYIYNNKIYVK